MPNHVKNIITLKGSEKQIREMLETIKNERRTVARYRRRTVFRF